MSDLSPLLPLILGLQDSLGQPLVSSQIARLKHLLAEVTILGLDSIRGQQWSSFKWAVNVIIENTFLHLQKEQALGDSLDLDTFSG